MMDNNKPIDLFYPKPKGYWVFPGSHPAYATKFGVLYKPNWFHMTMMRLILGFKWEDIK
jgi:hypothetical protein